MDVVDKKTRSRMMSGIKCKNTRPEILIRSMLHREGFRFRIHVTGLPGKPDLVLKKYKAVIFVHGCFWHRHDCKYFKWPKSRSDFWKAKLNKNHIIDEHNLMKLFEKGWRVCIIWECAIRESKDNLVEIRKKVGDWLKKGSSFLEVGS
jgi:DNA mismatch endonuclease, patch repair protein